METSSVIFNVDEVLQACDQAVRAGGETALAKVYSLDTSAYSGSNGTTYIPLYWRVPGKFWRLYLRFVNEKMSGQIARRTTTARLLYTLKLLGDRKKIPFKKKILLSVHAEIARRQKKILFKEKKFLVSDMAQSSEFIEQQLAGALVETVREIVRNILSATPLRKQKGK